ncbi:MAG: nucleotidyltransferase domain-containing protein [bacterium]|nr:nucleotidyltransferase domain-containing protein [bacterium]
MERHTVDIDVGKARLFLREKESQAQQEREDESKRTIQILKDLSGVWQEYKLKRVYLYGSVATARIHDDSDVDIAVEGDIGYAGLLRLFGELDGRMTREIDLRLLDELPFKDVVRQKGMVVYDNSR